MRNYRWLCVCFLIISYAVSAAGQTPQWQWVRGAGGLNGDYGQAVAVDDEGNSYITGYFNGTASFGDIQLQSAGSDDVFIAKLSKRGNWQWAQRAGGTNSVTGYDICIDNDNNIYITGAFQGIVLFGDIQLQSSGSYDVFIAKLNREGTWQWARSAGGTGQNFGRGIAVDNMGNSYITGSFQGSAVFGERQLQSTGTNDMFVTKLDTNGNWQWAVNAGIAVANAITVDNAGNSYVTGYFNSNVAFGEEIHLQSAGNKDIFIVKLDSQGGWLWGQRAGGRNEDVGNNIAIDTNGNTYVTGYFQETAGFGDEELVSAGSSDIFVVKLNNQGDWEWIQRAGSVSNAMGYGICADNDGNSFVTGSFQGTAAMFGETRLRSAGNFDIFLAKVDERGVWEWAIRAGGMSVDHSIDIVIDNRDNKYITGYFQGLAAIGETQLQSSGGYDIFVAQFGTIQVPEVAVRTVLFNNQEFIKLSWQAIEDINSYKIYTSDDPEAQDWGAPIAITTETEYITTQPMSPDRRAFYYVTASLEEAP